MKVKNLFGLLLSLLTLMIVGCGGDGGGGTTPFATAPTASAPVTSNDGTSATSTITATLPAGTADGTVVNFAVTSGSGTLSAATATTVGGVATVTLTSTSPGDVVVTVASGSFSSPVTVTLPAGALVVTANPTIAINTTSTISAQLPTATANVTVSFVLTGGGTLSAATALTDATGLATVTLTAPATPGPATVTATAGLLTGNASINYILDPTAPSGISVAASQTSLFVGQGPVTITATVTAAGGANFTVPNGTQVTFFTTAGLLTSPTLTTNGVATVQLDSAAAATASVTARVNGITTPTPVVVTFNDPNVPNAISIAANPTLLFVGQGASTITATVSPVGPNGVIADGTVVTFASTVGQITASATTINGVATATLTPTAAGTASVTATANGITSAPASVVINAVPTQAVVKLAINGNLPAGTTIDGAQFILNYATNKGLSIVDAGIVASGGATANLIINNLTVAGVINSAFANANASPIASQTGEFATLTFSIAANTPPFFPVLADFTIASSTVSTTPVLVTPLTISVLSVTLQ